MPMHSLDMKKLTLGTYFFSAFAFLIFLLGGLLFALNQTPVRMPLKLALNEWASYAVIPYGISKGYFQREGLLVEATYIPTIPELNERVANREFDGCPVVLADLFFFLERRKPLVGVMIIDTSISGDVILARSDIRGMQNLKGKTISFDTINSFSHYIVLSLLEKFMIKPQEVKFVQVPIEQVPEKIKAGVIDAGHTFDPAKTRGLKAGLRVIAEAGAIPGLVTEVIAFQEDLLRSRPDDIRRFVRAAFAAQTEMLANPEAAALVVQDFYKNDSRSFAASFADLHMIDLAENKILFNRDLPGNIYSQVEKQRKFFAERGQNISRNLVGRLLSTEFLP